MAGPLPAAWVEDGPAVRDARVVVVVAAVEDPALARGHEAEARAEAEDLASNTGRRLQCGLSDKVAARRWFWPSGWAVYPNCVGIGGEYGRCHYVAPRSATLTKGPQDGRRKRH